MPPLTMSHPQARGDNIHNHEENAVEEITEVEPTVSDITESTEIKDEGVDDEEVVPLTMSHPLARTAGKAEGTQTQPTSSSHPLGEDRGNSQGGAHHADLILYSQAL